MDGCSIFLCQNITISTDKTYSPLNFTHTRPGIRGLKLLCRKWEQRCADAQQPGHEAYNSPQTSNDANNLWIYTSNPLYVFRVKCLISYTRRHYLYLYPFSLPTIFLSSYAFLSWAFIYTQHNCYFLLCTSITYWSFLSPPSPSPPSIYQDHILPCFSHFFTLRWRRPIPQKRWYPATKNTQHHIWESSNYQTIIMILSNCYANVESSFLCPFASVVIFEHCELIFEWCEHLNMLRVKIKPYYRGYTQPQTLSYWRALLWKTQSLIVYPC
jgi:hypothetical protein